MNFITKNSASSVIVLLVLLVFLMSISSFNHVVAQTDQTMTLQTANSAFEEAFNTVLDAEQAGANVTALLGRLNVAADLLAQVEMAYRHGDPTTVADNADIALTIVLEVKTNAYTAKEAALVAYQNNFLSIGVLSVVDSVLFVFLLFLVWRLLKQRHIKDLLRSKPEVTGNES